MSEHHGKYDDHIVHQDPKEGFDATEPDSKLILGLLIASVILFVAIIISLQYYFDGVWNTMVHDNVMAVPSATLATQRSLEEWRMTHYEYTDKSKTAVRLPMDRAKTLFLEEMKSGKAFYPGKGTEPKPEVPPAPAGAADAKGDAKEKAEAQK